MFFSEQERDVLLTIKGVGNTVIKRLEQMGICSLAQLANCTVHDITHQAAAMLGATCWKNSPQAKAAIDAAITYAKQSVDMKP